MGDLASAGGRMVGGSVCGMGNWCKAGRRLWPVLMIGDQCRSFRALESVNVVYG